MNGFLENVRSVASVEILNRNSTRLDLSLEDKDLNRVIALLSDYDIGQFSNRLETLEDYFMKFYREDKDFGGALK